MPSSVSEYKKNETFGVELNVYIFKEGFIARIED